MLSICNMDGVFVLFRFFYSASPTFRKSRMRALASG